VFIVSGKSGTDSAIDRTFCDQMHLSLFLNVRVPANARYAAACKRSSVNRKQCNVTFERTSVAFDTLAKPAKLCSYAIDRTTCA
jgi:hypothetical protein